MVSRWIQDYYEDFLDPQQRARLTAFVEQEVAPPFPSVASSMKAALLQRHEQYERRRKPLSESVGLNVATNFNPEIVGVRDTHTYTHTHIHTHTHTYTHTHAYTPPTHIAPLVAYS